MHLNKRGGRWIIGVKKEGGMVDVYGVRCSHGE